MRPVIAASLLLMVGAGQVVAQTYRMDALGDLTNREVRIIQTNSAGSNIHIFNPATHELEAVVEGIVHPHGATMHPDGLYYYVTNEHDHTVDVIDTRTHELVDKVQLAGTPHNLAGSDRARKIYVPLIAAPLIQVIDMDTHEVIENIPTSGGVHNVFVTPDGRHAIGGMIGAAELIAIDTATDEVLWELGIPGGMRPFTFTVNPDGSTKEILVNIGAFHGFYVVDFETHEILREVSPPALPATELSADGIQGAPSHGIVVLPDQSEVWVSSRATSSIYGWTLPDYDYIGRIQVGNPAWLTATPDSRFIYIGVASHNETAIIDVEAREVARRVPVGQAPKRIYTAIFPEGWNWAATEATDDR